MKRPDNVIKRPGNARQCRRCDVTKVRCEVVCEGGKKGVKSYIDATTSKSHIYVGTKPPMRKVI